ncbi:MAG: hypothetical protein AAB874_05870 [Patescibacteria group bacterium]
MTPDQFSLKGRGPCYYRNFDAAGAGITTAFTNAIILEKVSESGSKVFDETDFVTKIWSDHKYIPDSGLTLIVIKRPKAKIPYSDKIKLQPKDEAILLTTNEETMDEWKKMIDKAKRSFGIPTQP